jgi:hypothetical protein
MQTTANLFQKAFAEKGLYQDVAQKLEQEKEAEAQKKKEEELKKMNESLNRSKQERIEKELYAEFKEHINNILYTKDADGKVTYREKGSGKLFHIICSHIPFSKGQKIWSLEGKQKECCFCGRGVIPFTELMEKAGDLLINRARIEVEAYQNNEVPEKIQEKILNLYKDSFGDRKLGYSSDETTTVICSPCYEQFLDWITRETLSGNSLVSSAIKKIRLGGNSESKNKE